MTTATEPRILCLPQNDGGATYSATKEQWEALALRVATTDSTLSAWLSQQVGAVDPGRHQLVYLTPNRAEIVAQFWPEVDRRAPTRPATEPIPDIEVMSWSGAKVIACSSGDPGVRNLYLGLSLVGRLLDEGSAWTVLWRRGQGDEPKWVKADEGPHETLKDAARACLGAGR